ncbi:MAG: hypothetical protein ACFWUD_03660 [Thermocaproicibacter melissae]|jgi:glycosyltransferase involved in cell wall biosynthesis|uniref:glycosyltransferase family 2 protein n=1 Tax=Thermocaproicibacter melissae TaxID=2966552 RepID=UPI003A0FCF0D
MNAPLISVIVPIYNVERYLRKCVDSILHQTYSNLEILLVDDGSPDGCPAICDEYAAQDSRIKVIHKKNGGASDARNAGLKSMNGDFVSFVDGDDFVADDYIQTLYNLLITNGGDIACIQFIHYYPDYPEKTLPKQIDKMDYEVLNQHDALKKMMYFDGLESGVHCKLYKSSLFKGIQFPVGRVLGEDLETTYKLFLKSQKIINCYAQKYYYLQRDDSAEHRPFTPSKMDLLDACTNLRKDVLTVYPDLRNAWNCRFFCANFHLLLMIPQKQCKKQADILKANIQKYRGNILRDPYARKKAKVAALLSYFGFKFTHWIWSKKNSKLGWFKCLFT